MPADFKFESEDCRGVCGGDFHPSLANAWLRVDVDVNGSISSGAVAAGCLANISAIFMLRSFLLNETSFL